jgi:DNA invertase Pin-like site-specific DNA recombinase
MSESAVLIGYARVSTQEQNPELQLDALRKAGCARVFVEKASGASADRPQLRAAIRAARAGDVLVVWKLDRLGRSLLSMIETVRELDKRQIGFLSLTENIDTTTGAGRLVLHVFGAIAEFERTMIVERTLAGLEAARARGRVGGRPRKLSDADIASVRSLVEQSSLPMEDVAAQHGIAISTLYRHVPAVRRASKAGKTV